VTVAPAAAALPRATSDRPDDNAGPQVHFVYAIPSDQPDRNLDADGTLEASIGAMQGWLRGQTGGAGLRIDTSGGAPDVTFVRLPRSDADYGGRQPILGAIAQDLQASGLLADQSKIYSVYYEGSAPGPSANVALCGLGGRSTFVALALVFLHDTCGYDVNASRAGTAGMLEYALLHETIHAIGFVPDCAPHTTHEGHVNDSAEDLMAPYLSSVTPILDVNHDDYFQANRSGCPDLSVSRYLEGAGTTLTFAVGGSGHGHVRGQTGSPSVATVDCPPACSIAFDGGQPVTMTVEATPDPGYRFVGWQGACTGVAPRCVVQATTSLDATAIFAKTPPPLALTVSVSGGGRVVSTPSGISCRSQCSARFPAGSAVRLRVQVQPGWRFAGWSGACTGRVPCNVRLTHASRVRATFRRA
jgi:hypothetical protein